MYLYKIYKYKFFHLIDFYDKEKVTILIFFELNYICLLLSKTKFILSYGIFPSFSCTNNSKRIVVQIFTHKRTK